MVATIPMPLLDGDFDVTEVSVPFFVLIAAGNQLVFATEGGGRRPTAS